MMVQTQGSLIHGLRSPIAVPTLPLTAAAPPMAGVADTSTVTISATASKALHTGSPQEHRGTIAKWTTLGGLGVFAAGCAVFFGAAAALAASPALMLAGATTMAVGMVASIGGACYGEGGGGSASNGVTGTIADPANPASPFNPANPSNPINLLMH